MMPFFSLLERHILLEGQKEKETYKLAVCLEKQLIFFIWFMKAVPHESDTTLWDPYTTTDAAFWRNQFFGAYSTKSLSNASSLNI